MEHKTERNSSVELLRIISSLEIVILHLNNSKIGLAFAYVKWDTINGFLLKLYECVSICAVNVFIIISAYYLCDNNERKISKIIKLLVQMGLTNGTLNLLSLCLTKAKIGIIPVLIEFLPNRYFIILYSVLYIISPYINILINQLNKMQYKKMLIILFSIFSLYSFLIDIFSRFGIKESMSPISDQGSASGYSIVNFVLLYFIGAYVKKCDVNCSNKALIIVVVLSLLANLFLSLHTSLAFNYNNPAVIIYATSLFVLFSRINFHSAFINKLSKASYCSYLINNYVCIIISSFTIRLVNGNTFLLLLYYLLVSVLIYLLSFIAYLFDKMTLGKIFEYFLRKNA